MMRSTRVDMFGAAPGLGSALDVLPPGPGHPHDEEVAGHARVTEADETVLVTSCAGPAFTTRVFNAAGETPFGTHSLAGVAACLVAGGYLAPGEVTRTSPEASQCLWTDGHRVRVPFDGPAVHASVPGEAIVGRPCRAYQAGVGRGFTLVRVDEDPRVLPRPDLGRVRAAGARDITFFRWDPAGRRVLARVFAPGYGIPEDAGCLPVAAALVLAALRLDPSGPVTITQVTARGTEAVFLGQGTVRDGTASLEVCGQVWPGAAGEIGGTRDGR